MVLLLGKLGKREERWWWATSSRGAKMQRGREELGGGQGGKFARQPSRAWEFCFADSLKVCDAPGGEIRGIVDDKLRLRFAIDRPRSLISVIVHEPRGWTADRGWIGSWWRNNFRCIEFIGSLRDDDDEPCQLCPTKSAVI